MNTSLGHSDATGIILHCKNDGVGVIFDGYTVEIDWEEIAANGLSFDENTGEPLLPVTRNTTNDDGTGAAGRVLGVSLHQEKRNVNMPVMVFGFAKIFSFTGIAKGQVFGKDPANQGVVGPINGSAASFQAPMGVALETKGSLDYFWGLVDFISGSAGGKVTTTNSTKFWGVAY